MSRSNATNVRSIVFVCFFMYQPAQSQIFNFSAASPMGYPAISNSEADQLTSSAIVAMNLAEDAKSEAVDLEWS